MSGLCSAGHISALVNAARVARLNISDYVPCEYVPSAATRLFARSADQAWKAALFAVLLRENVASALSRNPHEHCATRHMVFQPTVFAGTVIEAIKWIHSYQYSACAHRGWHQSQAKRYTDDLTRKLTTRLAGYSAARWGC